MTRKVQRHSANDIIAPKHKATLKARKHLRAHPVRLLPLEKEPSRSVISTSKGQDLLLEKVKKSIRMNATTSIAAGDNFYDYVNGAWVRQARIPTYVSSYGVSEEVEQVIQSLLLKEINQCRQLAEIGREQTTTEGHLRDAIGRLSMSALRPAMQRNNIEYLKRGVRSLGCMRNSQDIASALGTMCRYNVPTILELSIIPAKKNYKLSIGSGSLGLPAASYYSSDTMLHQTSSVLGNYTKVIQKVSKELGVDDFTNAIPFEASLAAEIYSTNERTSIDDLTLKMVQAKWPAIDWNAMLIVYGIPEEVLPSLTIYIDSLECVDRLNALLKEVPLEIWYSLFCVHTILHAIPYLPSPFDDLQYELFGKMLLGQKEKLPQEMLTLNIIKQQMSIAISHIFVKKYLTKEFKTQATEFTEKMVESAIRRMTSIDWFTPETQKASAEKLRCMKLSVAWSSPFIDHPPQYPSLQTDVLLANIYLLEATTTDRKIANLQHSPKEDEWDEAPYSVNAYYYHDTNELVLPAGSFLWPFFDMQSPEKKMGWNYGGLGAVIGHEITHAFDREGKEFNPSGEASAWWPPRVQKAYEEKTKAIIHLFSQETNLGRPINGALTLDENLADLGGVAIALDALLHELHKKAVSEEEKTQQIRDFFISYAVSWRTKEHPERRLQRLLLDKHAPVEMRVNLVVSQFEEWYKAFDVKTSHTLYIPPEERIKIF